MWARALLFKKIPSELNYFGVRCTDGQLFRITPGGVCLSIHRARRSSLRKSQIYNINAVCRFLG